MKTIPKGNIRLLRYEDLCMNTESEMKAIYDFIGIEASVETKLNKNVCHNIGGNPMRFRKKEREIKLDEQWENEITSEESEIFEKIAGK